MPGFCGSCGTALRDGAGFCPQCGKAVGGGAPLSQAPPRSQAPPPYQPAPSQPAPYQPAPYQAAPSSTAAGASKGSSTLLKVVLIVVGVFVVLGILAVAGIVYTGYRVKHAIEQKAAENGIDLGALTSGQQGRGYEPCSLLTTAEAAEILGVPVERSESSGTTCSYFIRPPSAEEKSNAVADALEAVQQKADSPAANDAAGGSQPSPEAVRQAGIEQLTKAFTSSAVDANTPYFTVEVNPAGNILMAATKVAFASSGVPGASESLAGVGDQAVLGPLDSLLVFTKNGTGVQIDLRLVGNGRDRGIAMAQRMLARM
jgi:zinc-ribbon domain